MPKKQMTVQFKEATKNVNERGQSNQFGRVSC